MDGTHVDIHDLVDGLELKCKGEHIRSIKREAVDLFRNAKSLFRTEDEIDTKRKLKNAWLGGVPKSTPRFGVSFETPVLKQRFVW